MLQGAVTVLILGFAAGAVAERLRLPRLLGMLLVGVAAGPHALNLISPELLNVGNEIRLMALVVILLKAGLGLDRSKITAHGTVALRLGLIPCFVEASVVAAAARYILGWSWAVSWVLGWVICAESPAVLVPMMLRLKGEGLGVNKGIPDLILAGGALSDVVAITVFGIVLGIASTGSEVSVAAFGQIPLEIIGGIAVGFVGGKAISVFLGRTRITENSVQDLIVALVAVVAIVLTGEKFHYSGYLAAMTAGFTVLDTNQVLARRIRQELDRVWVFAEIFLFVLIGAAVDISVLAGAGPIGLLIIALGLLFGRMPGIWLATAGSSLEVREKLFMNIGYIAKATVQAAVGALPLAAGVPHGEAILAFAVLAIAVTAPLGAVGTAFAAPRLLEKGDVDPTKVTVKEKYRFLVAFDRRGGAVRAFQQAVRMARQVDATIIVLHVDEDGTSALAAKELFETNRHTASDVEHEFVVSGGNPAETIIEAAARYEADFVFMGKIDRPGFSSLLMGDVTQQVIEQLSIPVIVVE